MIEQLESNYNCSRAGDDLKSLQQEYESMLSNAGKSNRYDKEKEEKLLRLENQIHYIKNKCNIRP